MMDLPGILLIGTLVLVAVVYGRVTKGRARRADAMIGHGWPDEYGGDGGD